MNARSLRVLVGSLILAPACDGEVLELRERYLYESTNCLGGINEQAEKATPIQCSDARNVWALNGRVKQRPGYVGIATAGVGGSAVTIFFARAENNQVTPSTYTAPDGAGVLDLSNMKALAVGVPSDRWYIGYSAVFRAIGIGVPTANSNSTYVSAEYWDGSAWKYLPVVETRAAQPQVHNFHLATVGTVYFTFADPSDWALTTIDGQSAYWIRFNLLGADLDGTTTIDVDSGSTVLLSVNPLRGLFVAKFPSTKRYFEVDISTSQNTVWRRSASSPDMVGLLIASSPPLKDDEPANYTVVPDFDEAYIAYAHRVTVHRAYPDTTDSIVAKVETDPTIVGPGAHYSPDYIAQLNEFPRAKYISYFKGFLWAAGIEGDPHAIRWSGPEFAYKVWPELSREALAENDNSVIKAIYGFGESMLVWKNDSMWQMTYAGTDAFGLADFVAIRIPGAVGCVSQRSVVEIHGKVYWLAEDGIYSFDGANVEPLFKDRIQSVFRRINPSRRAYAVATDWPQYNVYLLAVAVDGANANNLVIVYDYENQTYWLWDDIEAQFWMLDEDSADNNVLYFGDSSGRIYEMGKGLTDHGGTITSYVITERFARASRGLTKTARSVSVEANNLARSLSIELIPNDAASGASGTASGTRDYTDPLEVEYGAAVATSEYVPDRRRTRRMSFRNDCQQFRVKITHSVRNSDFALEAIEAGYEIRGRRR